MYNHRFIIFKHTFGKDVNLNVIILEARMVGRRGRVFPFCLYVFECICSQDELLFPFYKQQFIQLSIEF